MHVHCSTSFLKCQLPSPGFYCLSGSSEPAPTGQVYGSVCPAGNYCPNGTSVPKPCPSGTFRNTTGASDVSDCLACSPGNVSHRYPSAVYFNALIGLV